MKYSDTSKIVRIFTKEIGKASFIAKGARSAKSKFGASLEPLSYSFISFNKKSGRDLLLLSKSETNENFIRIQDSIQCLTVALSILESIMQTQEDFVPNIELFELTISAFKVLDEKPKSPFSVFVNHQLSVAELLGFQLNFENYQKNEKLLFSIENGSMKLTKGTNKSIVLNQQVFCKLADIHSSSIKMSSEIEFPKEYESDVYNFLMNYFSFHLEKSFKYKSFKLMNSLSY